VPFCLEKLARWCGLTDQSQVIQLLGDMEKLSETLARQYRYPGKLDNDLGPLSLEGITSLMEDTLPDD